jgi:hypothetical protein
MDTHPTTGHPTIQRRVPLQLATIGQMSTATTRNIMAVLPCQGSSSERCPLMDPYQRRSSRPSTPSPVALPTATLTDGAKCIRNHGIQAQAVSIAPASDPAPTQSDRDIVSMHPTLEVSIAMLPRLLSAPMLRMFVPTNGQRSRLTSPPRQW